MNHNRIKRIMRASIIAIIVNVALGVFKTVVGVITRSVAIAMDGVNNITDAASSFITILAAIFSGKAPDKKHPFGYGRIEYLGTLLIGGIILYAGFSAFVESLDKIIHPEKPEYTSVFIMIIIVAVLVKIVLTIYISKVGRSVKSDSLIASSKEAFGDILVSIATVLSAVLYMFTDFTVDAYLGAVIAILIAKAGFETLKETVGRILGEPAQITLVKDVKNYIAQFDGVEGAYDLILHNYGPDSYMASIHIAVKDTLIASEFDNLTRNLQKSVYEKYGIHLTSVGLYAINTIDDEAIAIRETVRALVTKDSNIHQMHGFYIDKEHKTMNFDLVIGFDAKDRQAVFEKAINCVKEKYPDYNIYANIDLDYNEV